MSDEIKRQYVNYFFFKTAPEWRRLSDAERAQGKAEFADVVTAWQKKCLIIPFSTVGTRADTDFVLWRISERLEDFSEMISQADPVRQTGQRIVVRQVRDLLMAGKQFQHAPTRGIVPQGAHQIGLRADGLEVCGHVGGPAEHGTLPEHPHDGHWGLRTDAAHLTEQVFVQHEIAQHGDPAPPELLQQCLGLATF